MKIGILTLSASDNCGSLLQAYALQNILSEQLGHHVEIIDFRPKQSRWIYSVFPPNPFIEKRRFLNAIFNFKKLVNQKKAYEEFRQSQLNMSKKSYKDMEDLKDIDKYDVVIAGSDQIWNVTMIDYNDAFFLGWLKNGIRISYAASLGGHDIIEADNLDEIKNWLNEFSLISVRECSGIEMLKKFCTQPVEMLLDPTMLLSTDSWQEMAGERLVMEDYIFYYSWAYNSKLVNEIVKEFSDETGLPVYVINLSKWTKYKPRQFGFHIDNNLMGPMAFLNLMRYSKYALVQSFHGVIFAYMMQRNFWFLDEVAEAQMDSRLYQILDLLDAKNRVLRCIKDVYGIENSNFNYILERKQLEEKRKESFEFLNKIQKIGE